MLPDGVVGFFWSPDGSTIAALQLVSAGSDQVATVGRLVSTDSGGGAHRRSTLAAAPPGSPLRLVFVSTGSGAIVSHRTVRLSDAFTQQVLPYFDQYALSHRLWSPDGTAIVQVQSNDPSH